MHTIKYILFVFIFLASIAVGRLLSKKYVDRVKELKEMKNALNIFKTKIKFTYEPIGEVFYEISKNIKNNIGKIFEEAMNKMKIEPASAAWEKAVDKSQNNLTSEDKQTIKMLSKLLRTNRYRRANKPNKYNRTIYSKTNRTSRTRKRKK